MPLTSFTPTTWVNNGAPGISAAQLNRMETAIDELYRNQNVGIVQIDSFAGANDTAKLNAALTYARAQTYQPWLQLPARVFNTGSTSFVLGSGDKILGAGASVGASLNLEVGGEKYVPGKWRTTAGQGTSSALRFTDETYNAHVANIAFHGNSTTQVLHSPTNAYACGFVSLTSYGCAGILGTGSHKFLGTQCHILGHWTSVGHGDTQARIGGSDWKANYYWNCNSGGTGAGKPNVWYDSLQKSNIDYNYITAEGDWVGLRISGSMDHDITIFGGVYEGRSQTNLATRPVLDIQGGQVRIIGADIGQVSDSVGTVSGAIHQSGGRLTLRDAVYRRGSAVAETFPLLYQTGGTAKVENAQSTRSGELVRVRWSSGTVDTAPAPANSLS